MTLIKILNTTAELILDLAVSMKKNHIYRIQKLLSNQFFTTLLWSISIRPSAKKSKHFQLLVLVLLFLSIAKIELVILDNLAKERTLLTLLF